jgi:hypothetical protein
MDQKRNALRKKINRGLRSASYSKIYNSIQFRTSNGGSEIKKIWHVSAIRLSIHKTYNI